MRRFKSVALFCLYGSVLVGCSQGEAERSVESSPPPDTAFSRRFIASAYDTKILGSSQAINATRPTMIFRGSGKFFESSKREKEKLNGTGSEQGYSVNAVNLPVSQAAKIVMGDILGLNYSIDPKIDAKITVQTARPSSQDEVARLFETALNASNMSIVEVNGVFRITSSDQQMSGGRLSTADNSNDMLGNRTRLVPLKYVSASEIKRILDPIAPRGGSVRALDTRNALEITGSPQEISALLEAVSIFDVDVMRGMSFAVIPLKSAHPDDIAGELKAVFNSNKDSSLQGMIQFIPNSRLNSILVVSSQMKYISRAEDWIKRLDAQARGTEKEYHTYAVQNRPAGELVTIIQAMFAKEVSSVSNATKNVAPKYAPVSIQSSNSTGSNPFGSLPSAVAGFGTGVQQTSSPPDEPKTDPSNNLNDRENAEPRIRIVADDANNSLIIVATPDDYKRISRVLETLDIASNQVLIEATIAEVSLNDSLEFGLRWYFQKQQSAATFTTDASGAISSVFPGFSYALKAANAQVTLNALNKITDVNVISSPSLVVRDNKTAVLQVGDQVPIATQSAVSTLTTGSIVNSVNYKDTGVILSVTPRVNQNGRVLLDIEQEVSSVSQTTSSSIDSPTIQQRRVKTTVVVNDSETLALGGLIQDNKTVIKNQVPVAGDIPLVGNLFKEKNNIITKTELIILITPRVIRDALEAQEVTNEYRRKIDILIPKVRVKRGISQALQRTLE